MTEELKTAANWAKELGFPEKKLKDAIEDRQNPTRRQKRLLLLLFEGFGRESEEEF